jgi:hypothetical protein
MKQNKSLVTGLIVALISFAFIFGGMKFIVGSALSAQNITAYAVFSIILGAVSSVFYHYRLKYALIIFLIGTGIGYFEMFRRFTNNLDGWGDLAGIISLFFWVGIGFTAGLAVQAVMHFFKKGKQ